MVYNSIQYNLYIYIRFVCSNNVFCYQLGRGTLLQLSVIGDLNARERVSYFVCIPDYYYWCVVLCFVFFNYPFTTYIYRFYIYIKYRCSSGDKLGMLLIIRHAQPKTHNCNCLHSPRHTTSIGFSFPICRPLRAWSRAQMPPPKRTITHTEHIYIVYIQTQGYTLQLLYIIELYIQIASKCSNRSALLFRLFRCWPASMQHATHHEKERERERVSPIRERLCACIRYIRALKRVSLSLLFDDKTVSGNCLK